MSSSSFKQDNEDTLSDDVYGIYNSWKIDEIITINIYLDIK